MKREDWPEWMVKFFDHLDAAPELPPEQMAQRIHEALEIAEAQKYATPESRFSFSFSGATEEDLATIRARLTPFENSIVEIRRS